MVPFLVTLSDPNVDFNVTISFNVKQLENGTIKTQLYLQRQSKLVSRIWSVKRCYFQRPWTTPNPDFKVAPFFWRWISHKRL